MFGPGECVYVAEMVKNEKRDRKELCDDVTVSEFLPIFHTFFRKAVRLVQASQRAAVNFLMAVFA